MDKDGIHIQLDVKGLIEQLGLRNQDVLKFYTALKKQNTAEDIDNGE